MFHRGWVCPSSTRWRKKGIGEVWFNPGADSPELVEKARALRITPVNACSIVAIGESPAAYR